jgi:hypothetical protein
MGVCRPGARAVGFRCPTRSWGHANQPPRSPDSAASPRNPLETRRPNPAWFDAVWFVWTCFCVSGWSLLAAPVLVVRVVLVVHGRSDAAKPRQHALPASPGHRPGVRLNIGRPSRSSARRAPLFRSALPLGPCDRPRRSSVESRPFSLETSPPSRWWWRLSATTTPRPRPIPRLQATAPPPSRPTPTLNAGAIGPQPHSQQGGQARVSPRPAASPSRPNSTSARSRPSSPSTSSPASIPSRASPSNTPAAPRPADSSISSARSVGAARADRLATQGRQDHAPQGHRDRRAP